MNIIPTCPICEGKMSFLDLVPMRDDQGAVLPDLPAQSVRYGCSDCSVVTIMPNGDLDVPADYTHRTSELRVGMVVRRKDDDEWHIIESIEGTPPSIRFAGWEWPFNPSREYADNLRWAIAQEDIKPAGKLPISLPDTVQRTGDGKTPYYIQAHEASHEHRPTLTSWRICPSCGKAAGILKKLDHPQRAQCPKCKAEWDIETLPV